MRGSLRLLERSVPELVTARPVMAGHGAGGVGKVTKGVICIFSEHADIWSRQSLWSWVKRMLLAGSPTLWLLGSGGNSCTQTSISVCFPSPASGVEHHTGSCLSSTLSLCRKAANGESCLVSLIGLWSTSESNTAHPRVCLCGYL